MENANKALVVLLVAALFISVFGALAAFNRIEGLKALTGAWGGPGQTVYGATNLTISTNLKINFTDDTVNFGSGNPCTGCSGASIGTDGTNDTACNCGWSIPNGLLLENIGNRYARINISNTKTAATFIGGTNPGYAWMWNDPENDGLQVTCDTTGNNMGSEDTYQNITTAYDANSKLCEKFNYSLDNNVINISFHLTIPQTATTGAKEDTWTATAVDSS